MTELSPAAQAVLDSFLNAYMTAPDSGVAFSADRLSLAAALRAVADQLLPVCSTQTDSGMQRMAIRNDLLVIAEELEAQ